MKIIITQIRERMFCQINCFSLFKFNQMQFQYKTGGFSQGQKI